MSAATSPADTASPREDASMDPVGYLQLARPALSGSRGRVLLALTVLVGGILASAAVLIVTLIATGAGQLLVPDDPNAVLGPAGLAVTLLLVPVLTVPAAALTARLVLRMPIGAVCSVTARFRWGWYARCLLVATVVAASLSLLSLLWSEPASGPLRSDWLVLLAIILAGVPVQAFAEEFVFRGVLLHILGARWKHRVPAFAVPAVLTSVIFALAHAPGAAALMAYVVGGVCYVLLCERTGGLEASAAAHTAWNIVLMASIALFAPARGVSSTGTEGPGTGAGIGGANGTDVWFTVLPTVGADLLLVAALLLLARRGGVARTVC